MKKGFKVGDKVVVNSLPSTVIYTIKRFHGSFGVELVYNRGVLELNGGIVDKCHLKKPTKTQLKNN